MRIHGAKVFVLSPTQLDAIWTHFTPEMFFAIGFPFELEVVAILEWATAVLLGYGKRWFQKTGTFHGSTYPAHETIGMVLGIECCHTDSIHDGLVTPTTVGSEQFNVARATISTAIVLVVTLWVFTDDLVAVLAREMFWMPSFVDGGQAFLFGQSKGYSRLSKHDCVRSTYINDWCFTGGTLGREECMVVGLTIGQTVLLTECIQIQWLVTLNAGETLWMPCFAQSRNHFL